MTCGSCKGLYPKRRKCWFRKRYDLSEWCRKNSWVEDRLKKLKNLSLNFKKCWCRSVHDSSKWCEKIFGNSEKFWKFLSERQELLIELTRAGIVMTSWSGVNMISRCPRRLVAVARDCFKYQHTVHNRHASCTARVQKRVKSSLILTREGSLKAAVPKSQLRNPQDTGASLTPPNFGTNPISAPKHLFVASRVATPP